MITAVIKSYFLVIVALSSIAGSVLATPYLSNVANIGSSNSSSGPASVIPDASAQSIPYRVDHHLKVKEKVGDPVRIEENINDGEQHCEMSCKYIEYRPGSKGRAGLAFIADTPADLSGAKRVHFFLMGENGGETVKVKIAGKNSQNPQTDRGNAAANTTRGPPQNGDNLFKEKFGISSNIITLPNDWQRFEVPLDGVDLKNIVAPFGIELLKGKGSAPQVVYLKYIVYDNQPVDERFLLPANATTTNATTTNATTTNATTTNATTADNTTAVESNNTIGQADDNIEETDNTSNRTIATTPEEENEISDNTENETTSSSPTANNNSGMDTALPTLGNQTGNSIDTPAAPAPGQSSENLAPAATLAVDRLVANPGDTVILDGSASSDPDGNEITYHWSQSDGPTVDIINADTATPTVIIPMMEREEAIAIDLVVSDGQTESNRASVIIDIQYLEEIDGAIQQDLLPDDNVAGEGWSDAACDTDGGVIDCLTDGSQSSFVSSDRPGITTDLLFSFQDPLTAGMNDSNSIASVTAQITAKKTGASGFMPLIVDDPSENEHYSTPSISVASNSFEQYSFTWTNNPVTGDPWTVDSLNSFLAGYRYLAGQGSIQISEFKLVVSSLVPPVEEEPLPPSSATEEGSEEEGDAVDDGADQEDSTDTEPEGGEEEEEEPAANDGDEAEDGDGSGSADTAPEEEEEEEAANDDNLETDEGE